MKLYESLPDSVVVDGRKIKLDLDFRNVLRMIETLERTDLLPDAREWVALKCICRRPVKGLLESVKQLLFEDTKKEKKPEKKVTSFTQDAGLIRAAFRQCYGIDLWRDRLHWIEFRELLNAIPEGNRYAETIGIRVREIPEPTKWNAKERQRLMEAKASVALELTEEERQQNYQDSVVNIFHALLPHAKEVKPCQTDVSSLKSPQTGEKHTPV